MASLARLVHDKTLRRPQLIGAQLTNWLTNFLESLPLASNGAAQRLATPQTIGGQPSQGRTAAPLFTHQYRQAPGSRLATTKRMANLLTHTFILLQATLVAVDLWGAPGLRWICHDSVGWHMPDGVAFSCRILFQFGTGPGPGSLAAPPGREPRRVGLSSWRPLSKGSRSGLAASQQCGVVAKLSCPSAGRPKHASDSVRRPK